MTPDIATELRPALHFVGSTVSARTTEFGAPGGPNEQIPRIYGWLADHQVTPRGGPLYIYRHLGGPGETADLTVAVPVSGPVDATAGSLPAGDYVVGRHVGSPDGIPDAYTDVTRWAGERGIRLGGTTDGTGVPWTGHAENFLTDPGEEPDPDKWVTELLFKTI